MMKKDRFLRMLADESGNMLMERLHELIDRFEPDERMLISLYSERTDGLRRQNRRLAAATTLFFLTAFTVTSLAYSRPALRHSSTPSTRGISAK